MLNDFLLLEMYFGEPEAACFIEETMKRYGAVKVKTAIKHGYLEHKIIKFGPNRGKIICWLTREGREQAAKELV